MQFRRSLNLHRQIDGTPSALALLWLSEAGDEAALRAWLGSTLVAGWQDELDLEDLSAIAATLPIGADGFTDWASGDGLAL